MKYIKTHLYKYKVHETEYVNLSDPTLHGEYEGKFLSLNGGMLTIKKGYPWDGPSGPTFDTSNFMTGSLVHDALYELIRKGALPREAQNSADKLLVKMCRDRKMSWIRAAWVFTGVNWFGHYSTRPSEDDLVLEAP